MAVKSGRYIVLSGILGLGMVISTNTNQAWSQDLTHDPLPFTDSSPVPFSTERPVLDTRVPERRFQALHNWQMTEKRGVSLGVMVREDPVYLNNNKPEGIAVFRYRLKF